MTTPRVLIAGLRGGGGKTLVSVGLLAAWRARGHAVAAFKKGPDYIDAAWLAAAAGGPCRNLDLFLVPVEGITHSFVDGTATADVAVIEGNRGLYDGADDGTYSTAELARLLKTPVVLVVDCTKSTRTVAALVLGCQRLDPLVPIRGVILNQTAGRRHEGVIRDAIAQTCDLPVLGAVPRLEASPFPERHLGLVPPAEHRGLHDAVAWAAEIAATHLDLDGIWSVARTAPPLEARGGGWEAAQPQDVRIGVFRDAAFQFYYPENLEALTRAGATLVDVSPIADATLPPVDAVYVGGGFPETLAAALADNASFRTSVRRAVEDGLPVYAECGGAVYLGERLVMDDAVYPMVGALPATFGFGAKPQGHGYAMLETIATNPFYPVGESLRGHEFHYTFVRELTGNDVTFAFRVRRGYGCDGTHDGLCRHNVLAAYTHVHALGTTSWAPALVRAAIRHRPSTAGSAR